VKTGGKQNLTLKEAISSSETSVYTQRTTRRYIPEDGTIKIFLIFQHGRPLYLYILATSVARFGSATETIRYLFISVISKLLFSGQFWIA
jgi:hypothetical protein